VLVPLCGDTPLIPFLADRGFRVEGIEVVPKAVAALLALMPARKFTRTGPEDGSVVHASADGLVTVHQYDFFRFRAREPFDLVYDRGALVAVQPSERERYADVVATAMGPGAFLFQDVIDRGGDKKSGPPFEVVESELRALYEKRGLEMIDHQVGASREGMGVTHYYLLRKRTE
jgi:thiopurine S-methyltransferase